MPNQNREKSLKKNLELDYFKELYKEHEKIHPKLSEKEWLEIFPEAMELYVLPRINELETEQDRIEVGIRKAFERIRNKPDEDFLETFITAFWGDDLRKTKVQLSKLKNLVFLSRQKDNKITKTHKSVSEDEITRAKLRPMEEVVSQHIKLKRIGDKFIALCPFHKEKTPSFQIFTKTNSYYCFGCNKGGNTINFTMDFMNLNFIEAVKYLNSNY